MTETCISQPMGWQIKKLGDLVEILDHLRVPVNSEEREKRKGTIPYYGANGQQGWIDDYLFDEPLILIAEDGGNFDDFHTRPIAYQIEGKSWVNNHAHILRANHENYLDFLFYSLAHKDIRKYIAGSTRSKLTQKELRAIEILTPEDNPEQARIAHVLDTIDDVIAKTEAVIAKLKQVRAGMLHDLLSYGLDENGQLRDPIAHPEQFKDTPLGRIPRAWDVNTIEQLNILIIDGDRGSNYPGEEHLFKQGFCVFLNNKNIKDGKFDFSSVQFITKERDALLRKGKLAVGDIVITTRGTVGNIALFESGTLYEHIRINSGMVIIRNYEEKYDPHFFVKIWQYLFPSEYRRLSSGSAQPQFPIRDMQGFRLLIPPKPEQERIVRLLLKSDSSIDQHEHELDKLRHLKSGLQDDLLTGQVRVPKTIMEGAAVA